MKFLSYSLLLCLCLARDIVYAKGYQIASDVLVFIPDGYNRSTAPIFPGFVTQPDSIGPILGSPAVEPSFGSSGDRYTVNIATESSISLYGTGEVPGGLLRNGKVSENWNSDSYAYGIGSKSLYQSHPWVLAVRADGSAFGVLALTTYRCEINLQNGITFSATGPKFAVAIFSGSSPQAVLRSLAKQIGTIALPPRWALGFQQSRWSYYPDKRVREIADEFRNRKIPADVIWLDIDYMQDFQVFTFNQSDFPDVPGLNKYLHDKKFHTVWMIDPGVAAVNGYSIYESGKQQNVWVKNADGGDYIGKVWPGDCVFPDFTSNTVATWWGGLYKNFMAKGIDGVWNDMNEPSVFNGPGGTMPENNKHAGGVLGLKAGDHSQYHNIYGFLMVRASLAGIQAANPDKRPFVLSRSNFIGGHRFAATWTGDNVANWTHMQWSIPMALNLGISGQPFAGPDIGGFNGNGDATLFGRWMGIGAFLPFSRAHSEKGTVNKEPWAWGMATEASSRTSINRRYVLLPYLYSLFYQASLDGSPIVQPAFFADLTNLSLRSEDHSFLLGPDLLIVPNLEESGSSKAKEPGGRWREIRVAGENPDTDVNQPRIKIRSGAIIPTGPLVQSTVDYKIDTLTLWVNPDSVGKAQGVLYEDEGEGYGYQQGNYRLTTYICLPNDTGVTIKVKESKGSYIPAARILKVNLVTKDNIIVAYGNETNGVGIAWSGVYDRTTTITTYRIKCRHLNGVYLSNKEGRVDYGLTPQTKNSDWIRVDGGDGSTVFKNFGTGCFMNVTGGSNYVECGAGDSSDINFKWVIEDAPSGFKRIKSLSGSNRYLHVEKGLGYPEVGSVGSDWWSAMWALEPQTREVPLGIQSYMDANPQRAILSWKGSILSIKNAVSDSRLSVYDVSGREILKKSLSVKGNLDIPLKLGPGLYICKITHKTRAFSNNLKIVVK